MFDILSFAGPGADEVGDVRASVRSEVSRVDLGIVYPEVEYADDGQRVSDPYEASVVQVTNPGGQPYSVRLVGIGWDVPDPGRPQQARGSEFIGEPVRVAAGKTVDLEVPPGLQGRFDSIKAYIAAD